MNPRRNNGAISIFLSIILSSLVVVLTILTSAANIRSRECFISSALVIQQDLLLSEYSEMLLDRYGLYGTFLRNTYETEFFDMIKGEPTVTDYTASGCEELTQEALKMAICEFTRWRFPIFAAFNFLTRYTDMTSSVDAKLKKKLNVKEDSSSDKNYADDHEGENDEEIFGLYDILSVLLQFKEEIILSGEETESTLSIHHFDTAFFTEYFENASPESTDSYPMFDLSSSYAVWNLLSKWTEVVHSLNAPGWYEEICFYYYILQMFSCKTDFAKEQAGNVRYFIDLRNRRHLDIPQSDPLELEKIIFGFDSKSVNNICAVFSVQSIRMAFHIVANYLDEVKYTQNHDIADALCDAITVISGGTIHIPSTAMEFAIIFMRSQLQSAQDIARMTLGEGVDLFPMKSEYNLTTYYKDYLFFLLLFVPDSVKLSRMAYIIKENLGVSDQMIYSGIKVSCEFRDSEYILYGFYRECLYEKK